MFGAFIFQRCFDAWEELYGAQVDVLVEGETRLEEDTFFEDAGGDVGVAYGTEED